MSVCEFTDWGIGNKNIHCFSEPISTQTYFLIFTRGNIPQSWSLASFSILQCRDIIASLAWEHNIRVNINKIARPLTLESIGKIGRHSPWRLRPIMRHIEIMDIPEDWYYDVPRPVWLHFEFFLLSAISNLLQKFPKLFCIHQMFENHAPSNICIKHPQATSSAHIFKTWMFSVIKLIVARPVINRNHVWLAMTWLRWW